MFYVAEKEGSKSSRREGDIARLMKQGCAVHGDEVDRMPAHLFDGYIDGYDMAVVMGIKGISPDVFQAWIRAGKQVLLIDKGFTRPKLNVPSRGDPAYWRMCINDPQPNAYAFTKNRPSDRIDRIQVDLKPFRKTGKHIVLCGSSNKYYRFFGIPKQEDYHFRTVKIIRKSMHDIRPIWYRPKPSFWRRHELECPPIPHTVFRKPNTRLTEDLKDAWCLVTHGSNACFDAIVYGIPVCATGLCASEPISEMDLKNIDDPYVPSEDERRQWLQDIAYCQFSFAEMSDGTAWQYLSEETPKVMFNSAAYRLMDEREQIISQYRWLHKIGKYFRGKSIRYHEDDIKQLISDTNSRTLLDYGCGKGWQYSKMKLHEDWGVPEPWMYDPGVPGIDKKPRCQFDGVICTDVMEHIPEQYIDETLEELLWFGQRFVFMSIACYPAHKKLPDGQNCHLTVRPPSWWEEKIANAGKKVGNKDQFVKAVFVEVSGKSETKHTVLDNEAITGEATPELLEELTQNPAHEIL